MEERGPAAGAGDGPVGGIGPAHQDLERIGVLGGTFDPPHIGHCVVAQDVFEGLDLDLLMVIPAADPPHREFVLPAPVRFGLVETVFRDDPRMEVSDLELVRDGPSYTVETLREIRSRREPGELFLVIGADQLREFGSWHRPEEIVELATLVAIPRGGTAVSESAVDSAYPHQRLEVTRIDVSGTLIRRRLRAGRSVRYLVPEAIREGVLDAWRRHGT